MTQRCQGDSATYKKSRWNEWSSCPTDACGPGGDDCGRVGLRSWHRPSPHPHYPKCNTGRPLSQVTTICQLHLHALDGQVVQDLHDHVHREDVGVHARNVLFARQLTRHIGASQSSNDVRRQQEGVGLGLRDLGLASTSLHLCCLRTAGCGDGGSIDAQSRLLCCSRSGHGEARRSSIWCGRAVCSRAWRLLRAHEA